MKRKYFFWTNAKEVTSQLESPYQFYVASEVVISLVERKLNMCLRTGLVEYDWSLNFYPA